VDYLMERGLLYETKLGDYESALKSYSCVVDEFPRTEKAAQAQISIGKVYFYRLYDYNKGWPEFKKGNADNYPDMPGRVAEVEELLRETNRIRQEISVETQFIRRSQKRKVSKVRKFAGYDIYGILEDRVAPSFVAIGKKWRQLRNYPKALEAYRILIEKLPLKLVQASECSYGIGDME
jgi:tetratricopeptide (TPR) repeat protein